MSVKVQIPSLQAMESVGVKRWILSLFGEQHMKIDEAYDDWSAIYDTNDNITRDLEKQVVRRVLGQRKFPAVLELGAGTGKNTVWLATHAEKLLAVDFSNGMLQKAQEKIHATNVSFHRADITKPWDFGKACFDLVTSSLVLEHVENLSFIFSQSGQSLRAGGLFYICELHPFKQYAGVKARFVRKDQTTELKTFTHHTSDFTTAATANSFRLLHLQEWFDEENRDELPRLISFLFQKDG